MMHRNINHSFAVIFDMDGVIVDSNPTHKIALRKFCEMHGYNLTDEELKARVYGRANKDWLPDMFGNQLTKEEFQKFAEEKEALFRQIFKPIIKPVDGLIAFLDRLEESKITKAVASSAPPANVEFTLEKTATKKYFDVILSETDFQKGKPDPEIYLTTASLLNFPPEKCLVLEDSIAGVESAKKAGCKVIGVTTTHLKEEFVGTDLVIDDFHNLHIKELQELFNKGTDNQWSKKFLC